VWERRLTICVPVVHVQGQSRRALRDSSRTVTYTHTNTKSKHKTTKTIHSSKTYSREHDVLVEPAAHIDGTFDNGVVDHIGQGDREIRRKDFRVEEHFGPEKALVADVTGVGQAGGTLRRKCVVC